MDYSFVPFKELAKGNGFGYPVDVYYGTVYLGTLVAEAEGFTIKMVATANGRQLVKQSPNNNFKSQALAAQVLHRVWKSMRGDGEMLKEQLSASDKSTSWLTKHGEFIPVYGNHQKVASKITSGNPDAIAFLYKQGWQRVTYYSRGTLYAGNDFLPPTDLQKRLLISLAKELNFEKLVYDAGDNDFVLWSASDMLQ